MLQPLKFYCILFFGALCTSPYCIGIHKKLFGYVFLLSITTEQVDGITEIITFHEIYF